MQVPLLSVRYSASIGQANIMGMNGIANIEIPQIGWAFLILPSLISLVSSSMVVLTPSVSLMVALPGPQYRFSPLTTSVTTSAANRAVSNNEARCNGGS